MGWTISLQNSYVEFLSPSTSECDLMEIRSSKDIIKMNHAEVGQAPCPMRLVPNGRWKLDHRYERRQDTP